MSDISTQRAAYRPDIDGLRGIAVLAVVFYHAGFTRFFGGGFVGVDIFFVLSGYLITGIIYRERNAGTFSFLNFYERRIRRIVPAFFVMGLVTTMLAWMVMTADDFRNQGITLYRAALAMANFYFLRHTGGYFDTPTHSFGLLHTWSLSVEEQFYFIFPTVLFFILALFRRKTLAIVTGLTLASLIGSAILVNTNQPYTFYMLPTRAWELLCGSILAIAPPPRLSIRQKNLALLLGLLCIAGAVTGYGRLPGLAFPGLAALPPCAGTMLCIVGGNERDRTGPLYGLLSWRPLVFTGLISYSLYLWHWPIFVLYRTIFPLPPATIATGLIALSALLAVLSWRYVERPVRQKHVLKTRPMLFTVTLLALGVLMFGGWAIYKQWISPLCDIDSSYTEPPLAAVGGRLTPMPERLKKVVGDKATFFGDPDQDPTILLLGDSHAQALAPLCDRLARENRQSGLMIQNNPPFFHSDIRETAGSTRVVQGIAQELIRRFQITTVLISARYALYTDGMLPSEVSRVDDKFQLWYEPPSGEIVRDPVRALELALKDTVALCRAEGVRRISLLLPIPEQVQSIPQKATQLAFWGRDPAATLFLPMEEYQKRQRRAYEALDAFHADQPDVAFLDPLPYLCPDGKRCEAVSGGHSLYLDDDHLSESGGDRLAALIRPALAPAE